jgi:hypothetical protein
MKTAERRHTTADHRQEAQAPLVFPAVTRGTASPPMAGTTVAGSLETWANRSPRPYTGDDAPEKAREIARAHLLGEQVLPPFDHLTKSPGPNVTTSRPGGNGWNLGRAPEPRLVRCRERGDLDAPMRDELGRIGAAARRWLDRNRA